MVKLVNRANMTTTTSGTGIITLGSAVSGFQSFAAAGIADAEIVRYVIEDGANWEIGEGIYTVSGTTLSRTVLESSNADAAISLSGSAIVFITAVAEDFKIPIGFAMSDDDTALTTGIKWTWYAPFDGVIVDVHAGVKTAPTGSGIIIDIHKGGSTIMATDKLDIDATEFDTTTAGTAPVLTTTTFVKGDKFEFIIDQIGSTIAGAGLTATMIVRLL